MRFFKSHLDWWDSDWIWRFWSNCEKWSNLLCICWDFIIGEKHYTLDHALHIRLNCLNSFSFLANYTTVPIYWSFWKFDVCLPIQDLFFWQCFSNSSIRLDTLEWYTKHKNKSGLETGRFLRNGVICFHIQYWKNLLTVIVESILQTSFK